MSGVIPTPTPDPVPSPTPYREIAVDIAAIVVIGAVMVMSYQKMEITNIIAGAFGTSMMYLFGKYTPNSAV
jgi:hypothetical protein